MSRMKALVICALVGAGVTWFHGIALGAEKYSLVREDSEHFLEGGPVEIALDDARAPVEIEISGVSDSTGMTVKLAPASDAVRPDVNALGASQLTVRPTRQNTTLTVTVQLTDNLKPLAGKDFAIGFFISENIVKIREDENAEPKDCILVRAPEEVREEEGKDRGPPRAPDDSDDRLKPVFDELIKSMDEGDYHIYLYPDGRRFTRNARAKRKYAVRCQRIYVHWLIYSKYRDRYSVSWVGKLCEPGASISGDFAQVYDFPEAAEPTGLDRNWTREWAHFETPPFAGGQSVEVKPLWHQGADPPAIRVYVQRQDRYALRAGAIWTSLGREGFALSPTASNGSSGSAAENGGANGNGNGNGNANGGGATGPFILNTDRGKQVEGALSIIISPWGDRDWSTSPEKDYERLNLVLGTTMSSFMKDWYYGLSIEVAPGCDIVLGEISGERARLAPGYEIGQAFTGGAVPTAEVRDKRSFIGFSFDTSLYKKIFDK